MTQTEFLQALAPFDPCISNAFEVREGVQTRDFLLGARITVEGKYYGQVLRVGEDLHAGHKVLFLAAGKTLAALGQVDLEEEKKGTLTPAQVEFMSTLALFDLLPDEIPEATS